MPRKIALVGKASTLDDIMAALTETAAACSPWLEDVRWSVRAGRLRFDDKPLGLARLKKLAAELNARKVRFV